MRRRREIDRQFRLFGIEVIGAPIHHREGSLPCATAPSAASWSPPPIAAPTVPTSRSASVPDVATTPGGRNGSPSGDSPAGANPADNEVSGDE